LLTEALRPTLPFGWLLKKSLKSALEAVRPTLAAPYFGEEGMAAEHVA
jgi:hypothetical protein